MVVVLLFITLCLFVAVNAQDLIRVDAPQPNATVISHRYLNISYTVIGSNTVSPALTAYYPSSLAVGFVWSEKANTTNTLSLQVAASLDTNAYPGGTQNIERKQRWRAPNCHFFSRYPPTQYDFSLVFTPSYPTTSEDDQQQVLGTPQKAIIIPLGIQVDNSSFPKC